MKKSSKKLPKDPNKLAFEVVRLSTEDLEEDSSKPQSKAQKPTNIKINDKE